MNKKNLLSKNINKYMSYFSYCILTAFIIISLSACTGSSKSEVETVRITKQIGDEIALETFDLKIRGAEEDKLISSYYGSTAYATDGFKFVLVVLELKNTTDKEFEYIPDLKLEDKSGREFYPYPNTIGNINNHIEKRKLSPGISEIGYLIYEIYEDCESYSIIASNEEKNERYEVNIK